MNIQEKIFRLNRNPLISDWFKQQLDKWIAFGMYNNDLSRLRNSIVGELIEYRTLYKLSDVVIGISGGIDSALTAALFKEAGYNVTGVLMPIHQNPEETDRGKELCETLGIQYIVRDLTPLYNNAMESMADDHLGIGSDDFHSKARRGNVRARLRMITLYDLASTKGGIVGSTDNFSELAAGFWTLHGDVGDVAPLQSLTKSWEVPALAELLGVPQSIVEAVPTDGLGIANGDEDQFGFSYLEFDIALFGLIGGGIDLNKLDEKDQSIVKAVSDRVRSTTYKRANPYNLIHPIDSGRFNRLSDLDNYLRR